MKYQVTEQTGDPSSEGVHKGRYLMDYSKKYGNPYDVVDKAKQHMRKLRLVENEQVDIKTSTLN